MQTINASENDVTMWTSSSIPVCAAPAQPWVNREGRRRQTKEQTSLME